MSTGKQNLFYPHTKPDEDMDLDVSVILAAPAHDRLRKLEDRLPGIGKLALTWAMQPVFRDLDPYVFNEVTEGGHAKGRSTQSTVKEPAVSTEQAPDFYIRPNGVRYYHRPWGSKYCDVEVLRMTRDNMQFPFLYGPPGTGKTAMVEAAFGDDLITLPGTGDTEVADLIGSYVQNDEGQFIWIDGPLLVAMKEGRPFLVDEIGLIDPKVLSILYGAMDGRREVIVTANPTIGVVKAADGFFVIGATNPNAPGVRLSEALISRFTVQVEVLTDYAMAVKKLGVDSNIVGAAESMNQRFREGQMEWAPQLRELIAYRDVEAIFGKTFAIENLIAAAPAESRSQVAQIISMGPLGKRFKPAVIASE